MIEILVYMVFRRGLNLHNFVVVIYNFVNQFLICLMLTSGDWGNLTSASKIQSSSFVTIFFNTCIRIIKPRCGFSSDFHIYLLCYGIKLTVKNIIMLCSSFQI